MICPRLGLMVFLVLAATASVATGAEPTASDGVRTEYDIVYKQAGDATLKLDIAFPAGHDGPYPAVLAIHGGAWRQGNKQDMRPLLLELAKRGFVAVSPQYRFCPKDKFPAQLHDVKAAVRFVKAHAKEYRLDPDRVGAVGFSAGAHLAMLLGVTGPEDGLEGEVPAGTPSTRIRAVVNYFGPTDLAARDLPDVSRGLVRDFLGGTAAEKPQDAAKASPVKYVSNGDAPILSFQGTKDPLVPHTQALELADAQTRCGVPGRVVLLLGGGHGSWGGEDMALTAQEMYAFLKRHLSP